MNLVQLSHATHGRRVAVVDDATLSILEGSVSIHCLASDALRGRVTLVDHIASCAFSDSIDYDAVYEGRSDWRLLPAFDHPEEPARCLVSGTGLTHKASAMNRQAMHKKDGGEPTDAPVTDSMKMFNWGLEGGKPEAGTVGMQPEWFYKGVGTCLRAHDRPLDVLPFADDGGEEPEIAGCYLIDADGNPRRVGFAIGNEFADHVMEKKNYLYLAPSKLRDCALGPELAVDAEFGDVHGTVAIEREGETVWSKDVATGEHNMSHSLANLEHHHFKYPTHRRPGDAHIHFYGADAFSFGEGFTLQQGDIMVVNWSGFGRPLRNPLCIDESAESVINVSSV